MAPRLCFASHVEVIFLVSVSDTGQVELVLETSNLFPGSLGNPSNLDFA